MKGCLTTNQVRIGSRVYYADIGPSDTGTIVDILLDDLGPFVVKWDHPGLPNDENVDAFRGNQLVVIEY